MPDCDSTYERRRFEPMGEVISKGVGPVVDVDGNDRRFTVFLSDLVWSPAAGYETDPTVLRIAQERTATALEFGAGSDRFEINDRCLTVPLEVLGHMPPGQWSV